MAFLYAHTCASCGAVLKINEDGSLYKCESCGNDYSAEYFCKRDLYEEAEVSLARGKYREAGEAYSFLTSKEPKSAVLWRGRILSYLRIGDESEVSKIQPNINHKKLSDLINQTPKDYSDYFKLFEKCAEQVNLIRDNEETLSLYGSRKVASKNSVNIESDSFIDRATGNPETILAEVILGVFTIVFFIMGIINEWYGFCFLLPIYIIVLVSVFLAKYFETKRLVKERVETIDYNNKKYQETESVLESGQKAFEALRNELESRRDKMLEDYSLTAEDIEKTTEYTSQHMRVEVSDSKTQEFICKQCGADLEVDEAQKLCKCLSCGTTFDYNYFMDFLARRRAYEMLDRGHYSDAENIFAEILKTNPRDMSALNGVVLASLQISHISNRNSKPKSKALKYIKQYEEYIDPKYESYFHNIGKYEDAKRNAAMKTGMLNRARSDENEANIKLKKLVAQYSATEAERERYRHYGNNIAMRRKYEELTDELSCLQSFIDSANNEINERSLEKDKRYYAAKENYRLARNVLDQMLTFDNDLRENY
ncbi:MAG: hypothetical protein MJ153_08560, partial [Clostridia bacterium]|nr:hypothetical protein [Clostridia bacterium]